MARPLRSRPPPRPWIALTPFGGITYHVAELTGEEFAGKELT
jgi:hypothetical protein